MSYSILYSDACLGDVKKLDISIRKRLKKTIEERLTDDPCAYGKPLRYAKKGLWSLRTGDYRVIYAIEGDDIHILRLGHRREVYE